jgi:hypothetical protein
MTISGYQFNYEICFSKDLQTMEFFSGCSRLTAAFSPCPSFVVWALMIWICEFNYCPFFPFFDVNAEEDDP